MIACQLLDEGHITPDEALARVSGAQLSQLMFPSFNPSAKDEVIATGVPASPGAAVGAIILDSATAQAATGPVILLRRETTPDGLPGMIAAQAVLTSHGDKTSHAAVIARGMGKPCVCGAEAVVIDQDARTVTIGDLVLSKGDIISVDGASGHVYTGPPNTPSSSPSAPTTSPRWAGASPATTSKPRSSPATSPKASSTSHRSNPSTSKASAD